MVNIQTTIQIANTLLSGIQLVQITGAVLECYLNTGHENLMYGGDLKANHSKYEIILNGP